MNPEYAKKLCLDLIHAESEGEIVQILKDRGLWDDPRYWRYYGDDELNWSRAGSQQARSDFGANEKLVNAIARLMLECMLAGINPEDRAAPNQCARRSTALSRRPGPGMAPKIPHPGRGGRLGLCGRAKSV